MSDPRHSPVPVRNKSIRCPGCQRMIYSRRRVNCEWCGDPLPEELRYSKEEIASIDAAMAEVERERRERETREEEERRKLNQSVAALVPFFFIGS